MISLDMKGLPYETSLEEYPLKQFVTYKLLVLRIWNFFYQYMYDLYISIYSLLFWCKVTKFSVNLFPSKHLELIHECLHGVRFFNKIITDVQNFKHKFLFLWLMKLNEIFFGTSLYYSQVTYRVQISIFNRQHNEK